MRLNYKTRKPLSEEEISQREVEKEVERAKQQLSADISETGFAIADRKDELETAKTSSPLDTQAIINLQVEIESLEDGLRRLNALKKELGLE